LLRLPAELRNEIYALLLSPHAARRALPDDHARYAYDLRILRTCRQIFFEARAVFRRLNTFVAVEAPWPEAERQIMGKGRVPVVVAGERAERFCSAFGFASAGGEKAKIVFLAEDLEKLTRWWFYLDLSIPDMNRHLELTLELRDPYATEEGDKQLPVVLQRQLLLPFGEVKDLRSTRIAGPYDAGVAAELRARQAVPYKTPAECLDEAERLKDAGNAALQAGDCLAALRHYEAAFLALHIVVRGRSRRIWADEFFQTVLPEGTAHARRPAQLVRLVLRVKLVANVCLAHVKLEQWDDVIHWGMRSIGLVREGRGILGDEDDEPMRGFAGAVQLGKIYYRTGLAYREVGKREEARGLLRIAQGYLPADREVGKALASVALRI
ncbi:uncharacterized protein K452DRAFT_200116, partial [Aplosporella prunicola CBS 121167]